MRRKKNMKKIIISVIFFTFFCCFVFGQQVVGNPFAVPSTAPSSSQPLPSVKVEQKKATTTTAVTAVVAEKVEYLIVPSELAGAVVHGDYDSWKLSKTVGKDGETDIPLKKGWLYLLEKDGKFFYPNGDPCIAWWSYAVYLGDHKWQNTCDLSKEDQQPENAKDFKPYEVLWPKWPKK